MALAHWGAWIQDAAGNVLPAASIEVRDETSGLLALLFSDRAGAVPLGNPFSADAGGFAGFFTEGGAYRIAATSGVITGIRRYEPIGTAQELDFVPGAAAFLNVGTTAGTVAAGDDGRFADPIASAAQYRALATGRRIYTDSLSGAMVPVALVDAATIAWNLSGGMDFELNPIGGNRALGTPSGLVAAIVGKRGRIKVKQDGTGGRTLTLPSVCKTPGGSGLVLSTAANAIDYIDFDIVSLTEIRMLLSKAWA